MQGWTARHRQSCPFRHHGKYNLGAATATTTPVLHRHIIPDQPTALDKCSVQPDIMKVEDPHRLLEEGTTRICRRPNSLEMPKTAMFFVREKNGFTQEVLAVPRTVRKPFIFCLSDCIYCTSEPGGSVQRQERESQVTRKENQGKISIWG